MESPPFIWWRVFRVTVRRGPTGRYTTHGTILGRVSARSRRSALARARARWPSVVVAVKLWAAD